MFAEEGTTTNTGDEAMNLDRLENIDSNEASSDSVLDDRFDIRNVIDPTAIKHESLKHVDCLPSLQIDDLNSQPSDANTESDSLNSEELATGDKVTSMNGIVYLDHIGRSHESRGGVFITMPNGDTLNVNSSYGHFIGHDLKTNEKVVETKSDDGTVTITYPNGDNIVIRGSVVEINRGDKQATVDAPRTFHTGLRI